MASIDTATHTDFWPRPLMCRFEDLMESGIIDPSKVVRCALENAASVAKTFLTSDVVVTQIPEPEPAGAGAGAGDYGGY